MRFQGGVEKYTNSNKLTVVSVGKSPMTEESEVPTISAIPNETIYLEKIYYHSVYVMFNFEIGGGFNMKKKHKGIDPDPDE